MALQSLTTDTRNPVLGMIGAQPSPDLPGISHLDDLLPDIKAPDLSAFAAPKPVVTGPVDPLQQRKAEVQADLERRMNPTKPTSVLGKIGHGFATAGNILGDIFAPSTMALIPGTQLNNEVKKDQDRSQLGQISNLESEEAQRKQTEALTEYTEQRPEIERAKLEQKMAQTRVRADEAASKAGLKPVEDPNGGPVSYVDDPDSSAYQSRQIHNDVEQARQQYLDAQTEVDKMKGDPNSPLYKLAVDRASTARVNAAAAVQRAQSYYGNLLMHSKGVDLKGKPLNGAMTIGDTPVGTSVAPIASKAIGAQAQFADVNQGIQHTTNALQDLDKEGGTLNDAAMVAALQDPTHSATEWAQGKVNANLTPAELNAVVSIKAMRERILAMRKASGGNASEGQVTRMLALLPGPNTPSLDMAMRQLKEVQSQADVLGSGVPQIHRSASQQPSVEEYVRDGSGKLVKKAGKK